MNDGRAGSTTTTTGLVVDREPGDPSVLRLRGHMDRHGAAELEAVAAEALTAGAGMLTVDVVDLVGEADAVIEALNGVAARRLPAGASLLVRVPSSAPFPEGGLHPAIRVEPMAQMPTAASPAPAPQAKEEAAPGSVRREGRGFVASYGSGRCCSAAGCTTMLSRYNDRSVCYTHGVPERSRRAGIE